MRQVKAVALAVSVFVTLLNAAFSQVPTGVPAFGTYNKGSIDTVNLATLNTHIEIAVRSTPGRIVPFSAALSMDPATIYSPAHNLSNHTWYWNEPIGPANTNPNWPNDADQIPLRASAAYGSPVPLSVVRQACTINLQNYQGSASTVLYNSSTRVVTILGSFGNHFAAGNMVTFSTFGHNTWLNGWLATLLSATSSQITFNGPQPTFTGTDSGTVTRATDKWSVGSYTDIHDTSHPTILNTFDPIGCTGNSSFTASSNDGFLTTATATQYSTQANDSISAKVTTPSGLTLQSEAFCNSGGIRTSSPQPCSSGNSAIADLNGNRVSVVSNNPNGGYVFTDSTGNTVLTANDESGLNATYSYTGPNSTTEQFTFTYSPFTAQSPTFGCSGITELTGTATVQLVTKITLPDNSYYSFTYEPTPGTPSHTTGRIQSVTLPTGGTITYTYNGPHSGVSCEDGGISGFTRQTPDGTWTYSRSFNPTTFMWTTTVTDPQGNNTVYTFSGQKTVSTPACPNLCTAAAYEVQRQTYQLVNGNQLLMQTILTCYNNNFTNCAKYVFGTPVITQIDRYTYLPGLSNPSLSETKYSTALLTEDKEFDFGATLPPGNNPVSDRVIQYGTYSNGSCTALGKNLLNRPCTDTTSSGGTVLLQTTYSYDANGNLLSSRSLVSGSTFLTKSFTYYPSGLIKVATGTNGATTTYTYGNCNSSYPTSVARQISSNTTLSVSSQWDCTGEALTSSTDENGQTTTYSYIDPTTGYLDPYWRAAAETDPLGNVVHYTYSPTTFELTLLFGSGNSSTVDVLTTTDDQGRMYLTQTRQAPGASNFDTVVEGYDSDGRPTTVGIPCVSTASLPCTSPATTTTYDNLGRQIQVTDGGGGYTAYNYAPGGTYQNDVLVTVGPAPSGENLKQKQYEYDGLSRLTSVCEITSVSGSGTCGQSHAQTGLWTRYKYDALGRLVGVCQNTAVPLSTDCVQSPSAGQQTRTYAYDGLGRLTSETNPESGTTTYTYDNLAANYCGPNSASSSGGDLMAVTDANGNHICYAYDQVHRVTDVTNNNESATNPCKRFRYDNTGGVLGTIPSGVTVNYPLGNLAEAETDTCANPITSASMLTDEWSSYSKSGELIDLYESTPHSGGYYHTTAHYFSNGTIQTLSGVGQQSTYNYGIDGEGRLKTNTQGSSNFVTNTTYNAAGQPLTISLSLGDSDNYTYDPNTGRMTGYTFIVGSTPKSMAGGLTWNTNGTLRTLAVTDGFNSGGTQTCNFGTSTTAGYDDLGRLVSANCGSAWSQTFSYDPFGNLTKNGSLTWNPGYNQSTNRYTLGGTTYDADGNPLNDSFHSYTWNVYGKPATVDSTTTLTYDAFDSLVEKNASGTYSQIEYSPIGKVAVMSGQTQTRAYVPLPGGEILSPNPDTFWHLDWLGSVRLASSASGRTVTFDRAFAPFGETYDAVTGGTTNPQFAGHTQDTISDEYDTDAREYHPNQGRWISPDPSGIDAADPLNPQSWNRYAYVLNNPLRLVDPDGRDCVIITDMSKDWEYAEGVLGLVPLSLTNSATEFQVIPGDGPCPGDNGFYFPGHVQHVERVDENGNVWAVVDGVLQCSGVGCPTDVSVQVKDSISDDQIPWYGPNPAVANGMQQWFISELKKALTPHVCGGGGFGFVGGQVKIPKTNIHGEVLGVVNVDKKSGVSTGVIVEGKVTKRLSLGGEYAYNWRSHKWQGEGLGFLGKETASVKWGAGGGGVLLSTHGDIGAYGFLGPAGGGGYTTLKFGGCD